MLADRRRLRGIDRLTLAALLLQFVALLFAIWHGHRELASLERRDAAVEKIVDRVDLEVHELSVKH